MRAGFLAGLALALSTGTARAEYDVGPVHAPAGSVRFEYTAPRGCPTEAEARTIVATMMRRDPFVASGSTSSTPLVLRTSVLRRPWGYSGAVELRNAKGKIIWSSPLSDERCSSLVQTLAAFTIPGGLDADLGKWRNCPPPTPSPSELPPPDPAPARAPWRPSFQVGVRVGGGFADAPVSSLSSDVGVGWKYLSLAIEGRADLSIVAGAARPSVLAASLVPCGRYGFVFGCIVLSSGAIHGAAVEPKVPFTSPYLAGGARAGVEWPEAGAIAFRASADVLGRAKTSVAENGSALGVLVGAGFVVRLGGASR